VPTRIILAFLAIFAVALCGGCRNSPKSVDDAALTKAVKARLDAVFGPPEARQVRQLDRGADQETISYISVNSVDGVVTLTGEVRSKRAKTKADELARSVDHVVSVQNNLSIAPGYGDDAVGDNQ